MTVSLQTPFNAFAANGVTTVFPYQFKILDEGDLHVYLDGVLKLLNVDYNVSGVGADAGGSVTFFGAPANLTVVSLIRSMLAQRTTDYQQLGDFLSTVVNPDFDRAILLIQDIAAILGRAISVPVGELTFLTTLPAAAARAGKYLVFDANGNVSVATSIVGVTLTQALFDSYLITGVSTQPRHGRGAFTLPATLRFFGDSFMEEPTAHTTSTHAMAFKAAALLGRAATINATSGNTSADKQDAVFASIPVATDCTVIGLGQNDAQFVGTGTDQERRLNDTALIHLANQFHAGVPAGSRRYLASAAVTAGAWTNDNADIIEGGALKSNTTGDTMLFTVADSRYIVVNFKMKTGNGGQFAVVIDGVSHFGSVDLAHGFHSYPFANIPTNTAKTFARGALVFDLGRRKPVTSVQIVVLSTTAVGNVVSILSVMGLSGDPLAGPLVGICDLSDRGVAGYATAAGSQSAVQCVSRIINHSLAVAGACGLRMVPITISTAISPATDLDADQFHPKEAGAVNAAAAISTALTNAARDWSVSRPDLDAISLVNGADGYVLLSAPPVSMGADFQMKRGLASVKGISWGATDAIPCITSIRIAFPDANGFADPANALYLFRDTGLTGDAGVGNIGNGSFFQVAYSAIKTRITQTGIIAPATEAFIPENDGVLQLGAFAKQFTTAWFSQYMRSAPTVVASLPAAGGSLEGARWGVTNATAAFTAGIGTVVAGGGANHVPVYCDGTNWRIG